MYKLIESFNLKPLMIDKPLMLQSMAFDNSDYEDNIARRFIKKYMNISKVYNDNRDLSELNDICDTFIVDSDQNWRFNNFGNSPYYFFLDWVYDYKKKFSYAASFGVDKFIADNIVKHNASFLLKRFDGVSVREESGVKVCKEDLNIDAVQVLDPVFVADKQIYDNIACDYSTKLPQGEYIMAYILDELPQITEILNYVKEKFALPIKKIDDAMKRKIDNEKNCSVEEFIYTIKNSKFVITDSYHGVCFSIIFNKPFICIPNLYRGYTRFESLLNLLGLKDRIVTSVEELKNKMYLLEPMDYTQVNQILEQEKTKSYNWLKEMLFKEKKNIPSSFDYHNIANYTMQRYFESLIEEKQKQIDSLTEKMNNCVSLLDKQIKMQKYQTKLMFNKKRIMLKYRFVQLLNILTFGRNESLKTELKEIENIVEDLSYI